MYETAIVCALAELDYAVYYCKDRVILAQHHTVAWVVCGTTLTYDDIATVCFLATVYLDTEAFAMGFAAVLYFTFTFFMCHDLVSPLSLVLKLSYAIYADLGQSLTVSVQLLVALAPFLFENYNLIALEVLKDSGRYSCAGYGRYTYVYRAAIVSEEDLIEGHFVSLVAFEPVDVELLACFGLKLLSCYFYDCVHYFTILGLQM